MAELVVKIYDLMARHRRWCLLSFIGSTLIMLTLLLRLDFREDISDFLPLDSQRQQDMQLYQDISGANRVFAILSYSDSTRSDPDILVEAADRLVAIIEGSYTAHLVRKLMAETDLSQAEQTMQFVYDNIPYFLEPADYRRMDSLLNIKDYGATQLQADREMLMLPGSELLSATVEHDPLQLFAPIMATLQQTTGSGFELYEGHIFTAGMQRAIVMMESPFGSSETEENARLLDMLQTCADSLTARSPHLTIRFTGGPVIAVGNAAQIKTDSMISVAIATVLILLLLFFAFRRVRNLLLIVVAIGWGWLFALAALSIIDSQVSIIVVGISSVILGIAVNYPLHLISHLAHTSDIREALREIAKPLVVGNITTVGAFLALVPLRSVALRDLGLFSAFLLIGTILFVLLWLPHVVKPAPQQQGKMLTRLASVSLHDRQWVVSMVLLLTLLLGYHSMNASFDADMTHINYMTEEQKADMSLMSNTEHRQTQPDSRFMLTDSVQRERLSLWQSWTAENGQRLTELLKEEGARAGFAEGSFDAFTSVLLADYEPQPLTYFKPLPPTLLLQNIDTKGLWQSVLNSLSDNFNYIGWACGLIVFSFLWFSFRSLFLAMLSFLPMAVSWLWILGIMDLCDIQFNIVNVILATFIFGQGDDYTIFMTEGAVYETVHRRPMLASYKQAIILSALIMFIGIGSLIVARHPALHSLAEVTIIGMASVVLMAFIFPPLIFSWYARYHRLFKRKPLRML